MRKRLLGVAAFVAAALLAGHAAQAQTVTGLYSTGVDDSGAALVGLASDPHYIITADDGPSFVMPPGGNAVVFNCCYFADSATSRWITDEGLGQDSTNITFELTFNLSGYDLSTVNLGGQFAADNHADIFLNGVDTHNHIDAYDKFYNFNIAAGSGFQNGANTLDFKLVNDGGPGALRVDGLTLAGQAPTVSPGPGVPEPAAWALMLVGFGGLGATLRRRRAMLGAI